MKPLLQAGRRLPTVALVALFAAVVVAYAPALRAGFIWDDDAHLTSPALRSWSGLARIWTEVGATQQYYPLLHSAFWLEQRLWGGAAWAYHLANVALHALAALLLVMLLRRLAVPGAVLAGFVFALHPVHVESVAWISEQKNTLSTAWLLGAAWWYLRFDERRAWTDYAGASILFGLALLTKTVTATLPAALLVLVWWRRGRLSWTRDIVPLAPWLLMGAGAGLFTAWFERRVIGAEGAAFDLALVERTLLAGRVVWFYAGKLLWPANLTFVYPRWAIDAGSVFAWLPLAATVGMLAFCWRLRARSRTPLAAALWFGGLLFPVLGFFNVYPFRYSYVADHFQYVASIPVIALAVGAVARCLAGRRHYTQAGSAVLLLAGFGTLTWRQAHEYQDNVTLFRATLARNPDCWMAHNNLGKELMSAERTRPDAIAHFKRAIALWPDYPEAHNNLGLALTQSGRPRDAIPHLETSLRLKPGVYQTHNNHGIALASAGRAAEAVKAFERAAALNPGLPNIHENWAKALALLGRRQEAEERFAIAARLRGGTPAAESGGAAR